MMGSDETSQTPSMTETLTARQTAPLSEFSEKVPTPEKTSPAMHLLFFIAKQQIKPVF